MVSTAMLPGRKLKAACWEVLKFLCPRRKGLYSLLWLYHQFQSVFWPALLLVIHSDGWIRLKVDNEELGY